MLTCRFFVQDALVAPSVYRAKSLFPSVPICRCPRCPSDSLSDRAIHTVPIMSSNQQVHIGPGPSRPTPTDRTFHHCLMHLLVFCPMVGTRSAPPLCAAYSDLILQFAYSLSLTMCHKAPEGVGEGRTPTQPLHTLGHHLRVEQCAVLL